MTEEKIAGFAHRFVPANANGGQNNNHVPTLLLLHGTGGDENDLLGLGAQILPGANLLSPRGKVLENGMPRFFRRLAEGVFDIPDLKRRTDELAQFIQEATQSYQLDAQRIIAVGFSNGANIAASLLLLKPDILRGAILFRPMIPLEPEKKPDLSAVPVLITAGRRDPIVPQAQTEGLTTILQQAGATVTTHWFPGGHMLQREDLNLARTWISQQAI